MNNDGRWFDEYEQIWRNVPGWKDGTWHPFATRVDAEPEEDTNETSQPC